MRDITDGGHAPVLLAESVAGLALRDGGVYVDATFGRGGHARAILAALGPQGRLVGIDRDAAAEAAADAIDDARFTFRRGWFSAISSRPIFNGGSSRKSARPPLSTYFLVASTSGCW